MSKRVKKIIIGILAIVSVVLIFNQPIKEALIHSFHPQINATAINKNKDAKATYDYGQVKHLTMSNIAAARANARNLKIVGVISIPDIDMTLPISKGITNQNLALSAGTFRPDMKMGKGNYALAGHNMSNLGPKVLFSPLYYRAKVGQKIYVTDMKRVYIYKLTSKQFVSKYRVDLVKNTQKKQITLITCDATGANRLAVRGDYEGSVKYKDAPYSVRKALSQKFNQ